MLYLFQSSSTLSSPPIIVCSFRQQQPTPLVPKANCSPRAATSRHALLFSSMLLGTQLQCVAFHSSKLYRVVVASLNEPCLCFCFRNFHSKWFKVILVGSYTRVSSISLFFFLTSQFFVFIVRNCY